MGLFATRGQGCYELWPGFALETRPALSRIRATSRFNTYVHKAVLPVMNALRSSRI